ARPSQSMAPFTEITTAPAASISSRDTARTLGPLATMTILRRLRRMDHQHLAEPRLVHPKVRASPPVDNRLVLLRANNHNAAILRCGVLVRQHLVCGSVRAWRTRHFEHKLFQTFVRPALSAQSAGACIDAAQSVAVRPMISKALDRARTVLVPLERRLHI